MLRIMKDLSDEARDLNLGDVLLLGDHVQKLSTGGQLRDEGHAVLVVVDLDQSAVKVTNISRIVLRIFWELFEKTY